jgi:WD40 repeat protein
MLVLGTFSTAFAFQANDDVPSAAAAAGKTYTPPAAENSGVSGLPERVVHELGNPLLHQRQVGESVRFTPDGKYLVSSGHFNTDSVIRVWDVQTGQQVQRLTLREERDGKILTVLTEFVLTPDGKQLIASFFDGVLGVWDLESGEPIAGLQRHKGSINALALSPDGKLLATAGGEGTIVISTLDRPDEPLGTYVTGDYTPEDSIFLDKFSATTLAFTPDGTHLVAGVSTGKVIVTPKPDGKRPPKLVPVDTDMANEVVILRASDAKHVRTLARVDDGYGDRDLEGNEMNSVAVSPDGKRILVGRMNYIPRDAVPDRVVGFLSSLCIAEVQMWDFETGKLIKDLRKDRYDHSFGYSTLSPDGKIVALGEFGAIHLIDAQTGKSIRKIPVDGWWGRQVTFSPDGRQIAAEVGSAIGLWDVETGKQLFDEAPGHAGLVETVAYSPDGQLIATGGENRFHVWDADTGEHVFSRTFGREGSVRFLQFSRNGQRLAAAGSVEDQLGREVAAVSVWRPSGDQWASMRFYGYLEGMALSPNGQQLVIVHGFTRGGRARLELWKAGGHSYRLAEYPAESQKWVPDVVTVRFSPDGRSVVFAQENGTITKWDTTGAEEAASFVADWRPENHPDKARNKPPSLDSADFTSDGKRVVCAFYGTENLSVWDIDTGELSQTIDLPYETCSYRIKVAPHDLSVAVSRYYCRNDPMDHKTLLLFDMTTGKKVLALQPNDDEALSMAFSPDGKRLVTGLHRGTALVWDVVPEK